MPVDGSPVRPPGALEDQQLDALKHTSDHLFKIKGFTLSKAVSSLLDAYFDYAAGLAVSPSANTDTPPPEVIRNLLPLLCRPGASSVGLFFGEFSRVLWRRSAADVIRVIEIEYAHQISQTQPDELPFPQQFIAWATEAIVENRVPPSALFQLYNILQQVTAYFHRLNDQQCRQPPAAVNSAVSTNPSHLVLPVCNHFFKQFIQTCQRAAQASVELFSITQPNSDNGAGRSLQPSPSAPTSLSPISGFSYLPALRDFGQRLPTVLEHYHTHSRCPHAAGNSFAEGDTCVVSESFSYLYLDLVELMGIAVSPSQAGPTRRTILYYMWLLPSTSEPTPSIPDLLPPAALLFPLNHIFHRLDSPPEDPHRGFLLHCHALAHLLAAFELQSPGCLGETLHRILDQLLVRPALAATVYPVFINHLLALVVLAKSEESQTGFFARGLAQSLLTVVHPVCTKLVQLAEMVFNSVTLRATAPVTVNSLPVSMQALLLKIFQIIQLVLLGTGTDPPMTREICTLPPGFGLRVLLLFIRECSVVCGSSGDTSPLQPPSSLSPEVLLCEIRTTLQRSFQPSQVTYHQLVSTLIALWYSPGSYQNILESAGQPATQLAAEGTVTAGAENTPIPPATPTLSASGEAKGAVDSTGRPSAFPDWFNNMVDLPSLPNDGLYSRNGTLVDPAQRGKDHLAGNKRKYEKGPRERFNSRSRPRGGDSPSLFGGTSNKTDSRSEPKRPINDYWTLLNPANATSILALNESQPVIRYDPIPATLRTLGTPDRVRAASMASSLPEVTHSFNRLSLIGLDDPEGKSILPYKNRSTLVACSPDTHLLDLLAECIQAGSDTEARAIYLADTLLNQFQPYLFNGPVARLEEYLPRPIPFLRDIRLFNRCKRQPLVTLRLMTLTSTHPRCVLQYGPLFTSILANLIGFFHQQYTQPATDFPVELAMLRELTAYMVQARLLPPPVDLVGEVYAVLVARDVAQLLHGCVWPSAIRAMAALTIRLVGPEIAGENRYTTAPSLTLPPPPDMMLDDSTDPQSSSPLISQPLVTWPTVGHPGPNCAGGSLEAISLEDALAMRDIIYAILRRNLPRSVPFFPLFL